MCFIRNLRDYGQTDEDARALCLAAVLASRVETGTACAAFTGMVMLHAAQYVAERVAEAGGLDPHRSFLGLLAYCDIDDYDADPRLVGSVVSLDGAAARAFEQSLRSEAAGALSAGIGPVPLAAACVAMARCMFAAFAVQNGASVAEAEGICGAAALVRLISYEVVH